MRVEIKQVAYHRNGVCGEGFHVVLFTMVEDRKRRDMMATVFDKPGHVAVLDRNLLGQGEVTMDEGNAWRGDVFEEDLRAGIARHYAMERMADASRARRANRRARQAGVVTGPRAYCR